jgi:hypothetical protein
MCVHFVRFALSIRLIFWCYKRQFERLMEMLILRRLDPSDVATLKAYRLQVKERLYRFNFVSNAVAFLPLFHDGDLCVP